LMSDFFRTSYEIMLKGESVFSGDALTFSTSPIDLLQRQRHRQPQPNRRKSRRGEISIVLA
jgi:hypothetical protein